MKKKKKRLGRICISMSYIVDLDDTNMVEEAKDCFYEDLMNAYKYNELHDWIHVVEDPNAKEIDIPEFLICGDV